MSERTLILGAGQAGGTVAVKLRESGYAGAIVLAGAEKHPPYERPPLSKKVLSGHSAAETTYFWSAETYAAKSIDLKLGATGVGVDLKGQQVSFQDGSLEAFDKLVFATGSSLRRLSFPDALPGSVFYLRDLEDSERLKKRAETSESFCVLGGGWIGLEVAATLNQMGKTVTVIEGTSALCSRVNMPELSTYLLDLHKSLGIDVRVGTTCQTVRASAGQNRVLLSNGSFLDCDTIVVGIGVAPNDSLASAAGLKCDNGIIVDAQGRTSESNVFAVGDVANHLNSLKNDRIRLESWENASGLSSVVAKVISGEDATYDPVPWFWSDQAEQNIQITGFADNDCCAVSRVERDGHCVFYFGGDKLQAAFGVNAGNSIRIAKRLIAKSANIDKVKITDANISLRSLL